MKMNEDRENECPICTLVPPDQIYQCKEGHPICAECLLKIQDQAEKSNKASTCAYCQASLSQADVSRCRVMENLLDRLTFDCHYVNMGCLMKLKRCDIKSHEASCLHGTNLDLCELFGRNCGFKLTVDNAHAAEVHLSCEHPSVFYEHYSTFTWNLNSPMYSIIAHLPIRGKKIMILCTTEGDYLAFSCIDAFLCIPDTDMVEVAFHILNETDPSLNLHWTLMLSPGLTSWKYFKSPQLEIGKRTLQRLCDQTGSVQIHVSTNDKSSFIPFFFKPSCFQRHFPNTTYSLVRTIMTDGLSAPLLLIIFFIIFGCVLSIII